MKKRLLTTLALIMIIMALGITSAWAEEMQDSRSATLNGDIGIQSYQLIKAGYSSIHNNPDNTITLYGYTQTYTNVDRIGIVFHLQYLSGSNWLTVSSYPFEQTNSSKIERAVTVPVSSGYSYRLLTEHYAVDGFVREDGITVTGSISK